MTSVGYDDRNHDRYEEIQKSLRLKIAGAAIVVGFIIVSVLIYLPTGGLDLSTPRFRKQVP